MKILLVSDHFPPADLGGAETSMLNTAWGLAEEGHEVHVLARYPGIRPLSAEPFRFHESVAVSRRTAVGIVLQEHFVDPRALRRRIGRLMKSEGRFDVILAGNAISSIAVGGIEAGRSARSVIARSHVYTCPVGHGYCLDDEGARTCSTAYVCARQRHQDGPGARAKAAGAAALYAAAHHRIHRSLLGMDVVFSDSEYMQRSIEHERGVSSVVAYEAVDVPSRSVPRATADVGDEVLFAGRVVREKGVFTLLRALRAVPGAKLSIVGSGPHLEAAEVLASQLGIGGRVRFVGRLANADLPAVYARARAVVVPSEWPEPFGIVAAEAALCGTPVIATAVGGLPEALAVENATDPGPHRLVPGGDVAALARALASVTQGPPEHVPASMREAVAARVDRRAVARRIVRACAAKNA